MTVQAPAQPRLLVYDRIDENKRKGGIAGALTSEWLERFRQLSPYDARGEEK